MDKYYSKEIIAGILLWYTLIKVIFNIFTIISNCMINKTFQFVSVHRVWLIAAFLIIVILIRYLYLKNGQNPIKLLKNKMIRTTIGFIVALEAFFNLTIYIPYLPSVISSILNNYNYVDYRLFVIPTIMQVVIILCQILFGIYLVMSNNKRTSIEE